MKRACVLCNGCPENLNDSARIKLFLEKNGWQIVTDSADADLITFNTCALTQYTTRESLEIIKHLKEKTREGSQLIVWGCLSKIDPKALGEVYDGPTFAEDEIESLNKIIDASIPIENISANDVIPAYHNRGFGPASQLLQLILRIPALFSWGYWGYLEKKVNLYQPDDPTFFYIKVATGCARRCAYCAHCHSRGWIRSKSIERVMAEFKNGLDRGFNTFSLLGTDLGHYGKDIGVTLTDLLVEMIEEKDQISIGIRNIHPSALYYMLDEVEPILNSGKIWYMEIPVESGSDRILKLMRRDYKVKDFKTCIRNVKQAWPSLKIRTQFMVGFPTETSRDFAASMKLIDELDFDFVEVYQFSPRPKTAAEKMDGHIPGHITKYRYYRMLFKVITKLVLRQLFSSTFARLRKRTPVSSGG